MPIISTTRRWSPAHLIIALLGVALALAMPPASYAKVTACRGDPILILGNWKLQSTIDISAAIEDVDRVEYTYYLPRTAGVAVFYDDTALAAKEHVQIIQQDGLLAARVEVRVVLNSGLAPVAVTTSTTFTNSNTGRVTTKAVSGMSGQVLVISAR